MAATPFKVFLQLKGLRTGKAFNITLSGSDVATEYLTDPSGADNLQIPSDDTYLLKDMIFTAAGVDTNVLNIEVNGRQTPESVLDAANTGSILQRQMMSANVAFQAGARVQFKQSA